MTDIAKDVQIAIQEHPAVQQLVASGVIGSDAAWVNGWIFDSDLQVVLENTQKCAIVVSYGGSWQAPPDSNTVRFPSVRVDIWADPTRDEDHSVKLNDAAAKCFAIYDAIFPLLHRPNRDTDSGGSILLNGTRVTALESLAEPELSRVDNGNGARMLRGRFGLGIYS